MPDSREENAWRAFCYLSGDLSPAEVERFEADLAESQQARETLAAEAELFSALVLAEPAGNSPTLATRPLPASASKRFASQPRYRLAFRSATAIAAAGILAVVLWQGAASWRNSAPRTSPPASLTERPPGPADPAELAALWIDQATQPSVSPLAELLNEPLLLSGGSAGFRATEEDSLAWDAAFDAVLDDAESTEWMLAAVSGLAAEQHPN